MPTQVSAPPRRCKVCISTDAGSKQHRAGKLVHSKGTSITLNIPSPTLTLISAPPHSLTHTHTHKYTTFFLKQGCRKQNVLTHANTHLLDALVKVRLQRCARQELPGALHHDVNAHALIRDLQLSEAVILSASEVRRR